MSTIRFGPAAVLTALAILLVACTGAPAASGSAAGGSPAAQTGGQASAPPAGGGGAGATVVACELLTDDDIEQVMGQPVEERSAGSVLGIYENGCDWTLAQNDSFGQGSLTVGVIAPGGRSYYERFFEPFIGDETIGLEEAIEGLGDKAARFDTGGIMVVKGDVLVSVEYFTFPNAEEDFARLLVDRMLPRLP
jgi:hypothetical protein